MKRIALGLALLVAACSAQTDGSDESNNSAGGPGAIHSGWFKTPEAIRDTMTKTWELQVTPEEDEEIFGGLRSSLGGVSVAQQGSLLAQPNELFVLATHSLSLFAAEKLVAKQVAKTAANQPYVFDGLGFAGDDDGCYADDAQAWCNGKDELTIGSLTAAGFDPNAPTKEQRKRLMHKVQAIGEFFLLAIDELTPLQGAEHAPAFLVDEVFLPALRSAPLSAEQEKRAWQEVIVTILMSGYFFDLPAGP